IEDGLHQSDVLAPLQVMQSRGGLMASSIARRRPVRLFLSGPAAGLVGAQFTGSASGFRDVITVDVGGTSSDIAVIKEGRALIRPDGLIDGAGANGGCKLDWGGGGFDRLAGCGRWPSDGPHVSRLRARTRLFWEG